MRCARNDFSMSSACGTQLRIPARHLSGTGLFMVPPASRTPPCKAAANYAKKLRQMLKTLKIFRFGLSAFASRSKFLCRRRNVKADGDTESPGQPDSLSQGVESSSDHGRQQLIEPADVI